MARMHWSEPYLNFVTVEISYSDGSVQTWDYECIQYETYHALRYDVVADFTSPPTGRENVMLYFTRGDSHHSVDFGDHDMTDFADDVFQAIEDELGEYVS